MAEKVGSLHYDLDIDDKGLNAKLNAADAKMKGLGDRISASWDKATNASKQFTAGVAVVGAAVVAFGASSVKAYSESQTQLAQLQAVIKSTGGAAGLSVRDFQEQASALQRLSGVSDEAVVASQAMLSTFTALSGGVLQEATSTALDMATALNGGVIPAAEEMRQTSILLGKALQDPDAGLGALKRVGVNVDELSKKFTAGMSIQEKQKLILQELNTEFGGSAKAAGQTFAGQLNILKESFNDIQEIIGAVIVVGIKPLVSAMQGWIDKAGGAEGVMLKLSDAFDKIQPHLPIIAGAILGGVTPALLSMAGALLLNLLYLSPFILAGAAIAYLWTNNKALLAAIAIGITAVGIAIGVVMLPSIIAATVAFGAMAIAVIAATWPFILIGAAVTGAAYLIITNFDKVKNFLAGVWSWIQGHWPLLLGILLGPFGAMIGPIMAAVNRVPGIVNGAIAAARNIMNNWRGIFASAGMALLDAFTGGIASRIGGMLGTVGSALGKLRNLLPHSDAKEGPLSDLTLSGRRLMETLATGVKQGAGSLQMRVEQALNVAPIINPSVNMAAPKAIAAGNSGLNIEQLIVNDRGDADYILNRLDRRGEMASMGLSTA